MWPFNKPKKEDYEIVISSDFPYRVGTTEEEGILTYKTFTEAWHFKAECETKLPVKMIYNDEVLVQLNLYLPAHKLIKAVKKSKEDKIITDLWIFLDDGNFFIVFPDSCDLTIDADEQLASFTISFSKVSFHSEKKDLREIFSPKEICNFVISEQLQHEIVEIQQKMLTEKETIEFEPIEVLSSTIEPLQEALNAIVKEIQSC